MSEGIVSVNVSGPVSADTLDLRLSHPIEADRDFTVTLNRAAPGSYMAGIPVRLEPRWHWTLEDAKGKWRLNGALVSDEFASGHGN